jgi:hypothetical protein
MHRSTTIDIQIHELAYQRFTLNPLKSYQRHVRELHGEVANREPITSLDGAVVEWITNDEAADIIVRYEWLRRMGSGTEACYGLKIDGELLGVVCFGKGTYSEARTICIPNWKTGLDKTEQRRLIAIEKREKIYINKTICLMRGACVPWAPKNAASFLISHACRQAHLDHGWQIFLAYSDPRAGEIGTVYQACNWLYPGVNIGRSGNGHADYVKDGTRHSTYSLSGKGGDRLLRTLGWTPEQGDKRTWLRSNGYTRDCSKNAPKHKWLWFEGKDKKHLKSICRYPFKEYPKRAQ